MGIFDSVGDFIGNTIGGITGAKQAGEAAQAAAKVQGAAAQMGVEEQRRQFDALTELLAPYVTAGTGALQGQQNLIGLGGADAQQAAISGLENSPLFQTLIQQGESGILSNASATGGMRGGNVQGALAQFRPQMLSQLINDQYSKLGGLTTLGQASAAGQAGQGMQMAGSIGDLLAQAGAAKAGGIMGQGSVVGNTFGTIAQLGAMAVGAKKAGIF